MAASLRRRRYWDLMNYLERRKRRRRGDDDQPEIIGGQAVGAEGQPGTIYQGYTLQWGDDFNGPLDIVGPAKPGGYLTNRGTITMPGVRSGASAAHYYTDPLHTGFNDSNRGVPVGFNDNLRQSASVLTLQTRIASTPERAHFAPSSYSGGKPIICAAAINTARKLTFYPGTSNGDIIVEARMRYSDKAGNPLGYHGTFWTFSSTPTVESESDEIDIVESNSQNAYHNRNVWTGGVASNTHSQGVANILDNQFRIISERLTRTSATRFFDGVLNNTITADSNTKNRPQYLIFTGVPYLASFQGESFSEADWVSKASGAYMEVDYLRVWSKTGLPHFKPLATVASIDVPYGGTGQIVLPSAASLWGDGTVIEDVSAIAGETNDPTNNVKFVGLPPGVTYNSGTRTISVDWSASTTPSGRLLLKVEAWKATGSTCQPLCFEINRGPKINMPAQTWTVGQSVSLDVYPLCDVGNLVPKTITVSGLPAGLSFSPSTGLITGTPTAAGSGNLTVTTANNRGQSVTATVAYSATENSGVSAIDNFDNGSGGSPDGWTAAWVTSNVVWTEQAAGYARAVRSNSAARSSLRLTASPNVADINVLTRTRSTTADNSGSYGGVVVRGAGAAATESGYRIQIGRTAAGAGCINVARIVNGTGTLVATPAYNWSVNTWHNLRVGMVGDTLTITAWPDGSAEPGTPTAVVTDPTPYSTAGWSGLTVSSTGTVDWEFFSFNTGGAAPGPSSGSVV